MVVDANPCRFRETTPAMIDLMSPLPGLSPVAGKSVVAKFDGGQLSSDGGILVLREIEQRLRVADRLAACIEDPRSPDQITHSLADIIRFRLLMVAAGYEDGNDASSLQIDPMFKMALDLSPSDRELCSQSTISRLENLPDARALLRMGRAMVDLYCEFFKQVPKRITLDINDTFDAVHGGQQLRLFNAHYDEYGFQPIVVFDGEGRFITAVLRPAKRPGGKEIRAFLRRLLRAIRANWPNTKILLRGDSHYCCPEVLDWCRANGLDYILGVAPTTTLRRHIEGLEANTKARFEAAPKDGKLRRFKEFFDGAASWSRVARIIARVSWRGRARHALRRHEPEAPQRPYPLRGCLLPARPGRKSHQVLEDASGGRPHLMHEGHGQPVPAVPACRRLLAHVGSARINAQALDVARCAVRHVASTAHQSRRPHCRDEDDDPGSLAGVVPRPGYSASRAWAHTAPRHLSTGA